MHDFLERKKVNFFLWCFNKVFFCIILPIVYQLKLMSVTPFVLHFHKSHISFLVLFQNSNESLSLFSQSEVKHFFDTFFLLLPLQRKKKLSKKTQIPLCVEAERTSFLYPLPPLPPPSSFCCFVSFYYIFFFFEQRQKKNI